jgi:hypothetical protein
VVSVISSSESWVACIFGSLTHTCLQQTSPAEATLQPMSDHSIALNVNTQLLGRKPPPGTPSASNGSALWIKRSNFNLSVFYAVFFCRRTLARF